MNALVLVPPAHPRPCLFLEVDFRHAHSEHFARSLPGQEGELEMPGELFVRLRIEGFPQPFDFGIAQRPLARVLGGWFRDLECRVGGDDLPPDAVIEDFGNQNERAIGRDTRAARHDAINNCDHVAPVSLLTPVDFSTRAEDPFRSSARPLSTIAFFLSRGR